MRLCHSQPRKIDSGLTRSAYTLHLPFLTPFFDISRAQAVSSLAHGALCAIWGQLEFSAN